MEEVLHALLFIACIFIIIVISLRRLEQWFIAYLLHTCIIIIIVISLGAKRLGVLLSSINFPDLFALG